VRRPLLSPLGRRLVLLSAQDEILRYTRAERKIGMGGAEYICPTEHHRHDTEEEAVTCAEEYHGRKAGLIK
jgi:hypothetical protein